MLSSSQHFQLLARWLALEADAEKDKLQRELARFTPAQAEASGHALTQLVIREEHGGLGGRAVLTLGKRNLTSPLPWTRLGVGTPIVLSEEGLSQTGAGERGVIARLNRDTVQVALNRWPDPTNDRPTWRLDRAGDEVARQRQLAALRAAETATTGPLADWRAVMLGQVAPAFATPAPLTPFDLNLNPSQREAVAHALSAQCLALIHGPPGTGKTTTLAELIHQLVARGQRVLACAPSNLGVDNLLEKVLARGINALRLGHPARVLPELRAHTLDELVENHPEVRRAEKLAREARQLRAQASKWTRAKPEPGARQALRAEADDLMAESRRVEAEVTTRLLDHAQVIAATLTGLDPNLLGPRRFDWVVMDEAGQSTEPAQWIPLLYAPRAVLAGDPYQLPPTVISPQAAAQGLALSLLERLMRDADATLSRRLTVQYRMHADIMDFSSRMFYVGSQVAHPSVQAHLLRGLPGVADTPLTATPIHFVDTAGAGHDDEAEADGDSRLNPGEASVVAAWARALLAAGVPPTALAVITPYAAQARLLRSLLPLAEVDIDTVDGFQGREKEAVVISLVRANREGEVGFLADTRRMNVALTRARRKLVVVGDSATLSQHPFYRDLLDYFEQVNAYHSVWEGVVS